MESNSQFYQLTHDYLVPSLRDWLTRKQRQTRSGRAELRLEERSEIWNLKPNADYLPSWWEVANILILTKRRNWTTPQRRMMRAALKQQSQRIGIGVFFVCLLVFFGWEANGRIRAAALVEQIVGAETVRTPVILRELGGYGRWSVPLLKKALDSAGKGSRNEVNIRLALLANDPAQADFLLDQALKSEPDEFAVLRDALVDHRGHVADTLWTLLENPAENPDRRLKSGLLLARFFALGPQDAATTPTESAPDRWQKNASFLTSRLLETAVHDSARYDALVNGLSDVGSVLLPSLREAYHDPKQDAARRKIAMNTVERLAPDNVELLADVLITSGDAERADKHLPILQKHSTAVMQFLNAELKRVPDEFLKPDWNDNPLDPSWSEPELELRRRIESAEGFLTDRFGLCQTLPLNDLGTIAEQLRGSGYRPLKVRPFQSGNGVLVAVIWLRDGGNFRFVSGLTAEEVLLKQSEWKDDDIVPQDLAGYLDGDFRFAMLGSRDPDVTEAFLTIGVTEAGIYADFDSHNKMDQRHATIQFCLDAKGELRHCRVWHRHKSTTSRYGSVQTTGIGQKAYEAVFQNAVLPLVEVSISGTPTPISSRERYLSSLEATEDVLQKQPEDVSARTNRAYVLVLLEEDARALEDLDWVVAKASDSIIGRGLRACVYARTNRIDEARLDLAELRKLSSDQFSVAYYDAIICAFLGEPESAFARLEQLIKVQGDDSNLIYNASNAYAWGAKALSQRDPTRAAILANRSIELIRDAISKGFSNYLLIRTDPDLEGVHGHPGYEQIVNEERYDRFYIALSMTTPHRAAIESHGLSPVEHLARCRQLSAEGCRPQSIGVTSVGGTEQFATASAWHQPVISDDARDDLALRQARAAILLLRTGHPQLLWPMLRQPPLSDPRLRTFLIHYLARLRADPLVLVQRLDDETDDSARQALILALGEYPPESLIEGIQQRLRSRLADLFRTHPDSGVHAAAEWTLRRCGWNRETELSDPRPLPTEAHDSRRWYIDGQGHAMIIIPGPTEFTMGAPYYEPDKRFDDRLHRRQIGRTYSIASKEVTGEQFERFLKAHPEVRHPDHQKNNVDPARPAAWMTWFEAAQYCRWLSGEEGIDETQMCYPPIDQIKVGMLVENLVQKTGYRLTTEAEWEYACRAGSVTAFHFGGSSTLLEQYAWGSQNAGDRPHPVGLLKPNLQGLFDIVGNIDEWSHQVYRSDYPLRVNAVVEDTVATGRIGGGNRVLRGGDFRGHPQEMRSARRAGNAPLTRDAANGFRIARTISVTDNEQGGK